MGERRMKLNISVLGGGSWGTAIANLLAKKGHKTSLYIRNTDQAKAMEETRVNEKYLPGVKLDPSLALTSDMEEAVLGREVLVLGVPSSAARSTLEDIGSIRGQDPAYLVNLAKGLEEGTGKRVSQVAQEVLPSFPFVALSGPSHAEEVAQGIPTTIVAASQDQEAARMIQEAFTKDYFRVYTQADLVAVEMGGALKNIIALAAGLSDGLGYGDNTKAALMTRGMYEISKLGIKMGGQPASFQGLSGMGDLIVTCTSMHSRNRRFGIALGQGKSVDEAMDEVGMVVEGYRTTRVARDLGLKEGVEMPITYKLYQVLYEGMDPNQAVLDLMTRKSKREIEDIFYG